MATNPADIVTTPATTTGVIPADTGADVSGLTADQRLALTLEADRLRSTAGNLDPQDVSARDAEDFQASLDQRRMEERISDRIDLERQPESERTTFSNT